MKAAQSGAGAETEINSVATHLDASRHCREMFSFTFFGKLLSVAVSFLFAFSQKVKIVYTSLAGILFYDLFHISGQGDRPLAAISGVPRAPFEVPSPLYFSSQKLYVFLSLNDVLIWQNNKQQLKRLSSVNCNAFSRGFLCIFLTYALALKHQLDGYG